MIIVANVVGAKVKEGKLIMKTFMLKKENVEHKWYVIDAEGKTLGKVAERAAFVLRGKHKPTFTPHVACGDNVIIINAEKVVLTGDKLDSKMYYNHSGYPGGLRERNAKTMIEKYPVEIRVSNNSIALLRRGNYPDATNGIFYGVKDINCYKLGLERKRDKVYLRIEHDSSTVHTFPQKGDTIANSRDVQIFEDNVFETLVPVLDSIS